MGCENGLKTEAGKDIVFEAVHGAEAAVGSIVKPAQVQHAVDRVEQQLHAQLYATVARLSPGFRHADDNLAGRDTAAGVAVELEGEDVGGAGDAHEALVKLGHASVAYQRYRQILQSRRKKLVRASKLRAEERRRRAAERDLGANGKRQGLLLLTRCGGTLSVGHAVLNTGSGGAAGGCCWDGYAMRPW